MSRRHVRRRHVRRRLGTLAVAAALLSPLAACKEVESTSTVGYHPSAVGPVSSTGLPMVTFTPEGAKRVALQTATAVRLGAQVVVPYAALIYDKSGKTWVYTARTPLTFVRTQVKVDRIDADRVLLTDGLAPATAVVTVGAAEVYGAELGIEGKH